MSIVNYNPKLKLTNILNVRTLREEELPNIQKKCEGWEELVSDLRKEIIWQNFKARIKELPKCFVQFYRDVRHNTVFQWSKITIFNVFNQTYKKCYAKYGKCTDPQTYFSEKKI